MLRMQVQNTPLQKSYELNVGVQTFSVEFRGANRQFDWLEIPLFYDDSLRWSCNDDVQKRLIQNMQIIQYFNN